MKLINRVKLIIRMEDFFMSRKKNGLVAKLTKELIENENIEDVADLQSILKEMLKQGVETLLEGELEEELGYSKVSVKKTTPKTSNIVFMKR
jgi:transposase-like protein